jgi:riboflavin kinase / FMN adenylyltransferase
MQVFRHFPQHPFAPVALAIGNFDGVHRGHQALLQRLVEVADSENLKSAVMTFDPHPREFFTPQQAPARLTSLREKLELFEEASIDQVYVCHFTKRFAAVTAEAFMQDILRGSLNAQAILVGEDFHFGAGRRGSIADIKAAGFNLIRLNNLMYKDERVSSTLVREALAAGNLEQAAQLLGRPYSISGKVVHGAERGRQLGFPTANIHMRHERPALRGVYAVKLSPVKFGPDTPDGLEGVANLGLRPTVAGIPRLTLEVHVLDFDGDLYGKHVHVSFLEKLRDEIKFPDFEALKHQITRDTVEAKNYFKNIKNKQQ